jgi:hypothetical protein
MRGREPGVGPAPSPPVTGRALALPASTDGAPVTHDPFDVPLHDEELLAEVQLMTDLIIAATDTSGVLTRAEVDRLLGLPPR